jgi:hypothetical protein
MFRNSRISVLLVLVLFLHHPALVLVFKQNLCLSLTRWLWRLASSVFFLLSFSSSCLVSSSLSEMWFVLRFQRSALWPTNHPALELGFLCVDLLGACFFALTPFSGAKSEICQPALYCQCVMLVCWLFFNFATSFDFGCCSLAQKMSFVDHYLPYFRQRLTTHPLLACLPFQTLFTVSLCAYQLLAPHSFSGALRAPHSLCCMFLFSSSFISVVLFFQGRGQSVQGAMVVYPRGSCGNTVCHLFPHLLVCISQAGLEPASGSTGALLFSQCNVPWKRFVWGWGFSVWSFDSSWWFFLPRVPPASQQNFGFMELTLSVSAF